MPVSTNEKMFSESTGACAVIAAAVLLVGKLEQSPMANTLLYSGFLCCSVASSTLTHPVASAIGLPLITSSGPIGGTACSSAYSVLTSVPSARLNVATRLPASIAVRFVENSAGIPRDRRSALSASEYFLTENIEGMPFQNSTWTVSLRAVRR